MKRAPFTELEKPPTRILRFALILSSLTAILLLALAWPLINEFLWPGSHNSARSALLLTATPSPFQPTVTLQPPSPTPTPGAPAPANMGALSGDILLGLSQQGYGQLYWYHLAGEPYTRLTNGNWDDIQPALNAEGSQLAFASDRSGSWDLYVLDLASGETARITNDAAYDGHPSWSSDGWLAYEHMDGENLELYIQPADGSLDPVLVTSHVAADYASAWRPGAQQIAFVSTRSGLPKLWLLDLEGSGDERFQLLDESDSLQTAPAWSPDGTWLAWAEQEDASWAIYARDLSKSNATSIRLGPGTNPQWNSAGTAVLAELDYATSNYLTAYDLQGGLALAPAELPGGLQGATWGDSALAEPLPAPMAGFAIPVQRPDPATGTLAALDDVSAPDAQLNSAAIDAFDALRQRAARAAGWDMLSSLEQAYVNLDEPLPPARQQDWLYTGRAFELHPALLDAGWMALVRQEFNGDTYWRVYLRTADQNGGLGGPLTGLVWDFEARSLIPAPAGMWIDFTALAADFGFERLPALPNWRTYYPGALFNQFAFKAGLSWEEAMLQLYTPEQVAAILAAK